MGRTMTDSQLEYIREAPDSVRMVHDLLKELDAEREVSRKLAEALRSIMQNQSAANMAAGSEALALYWEAK